MHAISTADNAHCLRLPHTQHRTPLHLASCCGNTAVLEYLLLQDTVLLNAVDRIYIYMCIYIYIYI